MSLPMATSWVTESSLRSWWLLPPGRARSESTCFRRISARTPPPIPPAAPLSPRRLARGGPTRQQRQKARLSTAPFAGGSSGLGGGGMELAAPRRPPTAEQGNDSLEMIGGKSRAVAVLGLLDGVPVVRVSFIWCAEEDQSRTSRIPSLSFKRNCKL